MRRFIQIVSENAGRIVAYHSGDPVITEFWPWTHFGTEIAAKQRMSQRGGEAMHVVHLDIKNPLKVSDMEASDEAALLNAIAAGRYPQIDVGRARREGVIAACEAAGYDGLVYNNRMERRGRLSWVIFHPQQAHFAQMSDDRTINLARDAILEAIPEAQEIRRYMEIVENVQGDPATIIQRARAAGLNGFGGLCGEAALAINRVVFGDRGQLVAAYNKALLPTGSGPGHYIGHVAVFANAAYWDADGRPKTKDEIEAWGMLDPEDPEWAEYAEEKGVEWNDEAANEVGIFKLNEEGIQHIYGTQHLAAMIALLEEAKQ